MKRKPFFPFGGYTIRLKLPEKRGPVPIFVINLILDPKKAELSD